MRSYWSDIVFLFRGDGPRLVLVVERDEGEFALRDERFCLAVALAGEGFSLEAQRRAALSQQLDIDAELVANGHRAGEFDGVRRDQDRLSAATARGEGAAGEAHLPDQPSAEHAAVWVGVGGHRGHA